MTDEARREAVGMVVMKPKHWLRAALIEESRGFEGVSFLTGCSDEWTPFQGRIDWQFEDSHFTTDPSEVTCRECLDRIEAGTDKESITSRDEGAEDR